jgi:hypothetical protein
MFDFDMPGEDSDETVPMFDLLDDPTDAESDKPAMSHFDPSDSFEDIGSVENSFYPSIGYSKVTDTAAVDSYLMQLDDAELRGEKEMVDTFVNLTSSSAWMPSDFNEPDSGLTFDDPLFEPISLAGKCTTENVEAIDPANVSLIAPAGPTDTTDPEAEDLNCFDVAPAVPTDNNDPEVEDLNCFDVTPAVPTDTNEPGEDLHYFDAIEDIFEPGKHLHFFDAQDDIDSHGLHFSDPSDHIEGFGFVGHAFCLSLNYDKVIDSADVSHFLMQLDHTELRGENENLDSFACVSRAAIQDQAERYVECLGYGPDHEMTWNRGASMCDKGALTYEDDTDSESESDNETCTVTEGFSVVLFWLTRVLLGGRLTQIRPGSMEKGEDLYFFDATDAPLGMEIAPSVSLLVTPTPPSTVSDRSNTADSRGATDVPDSSDEKADCFEDESDLVKSIYTRWAERWVDTAHRITEFLSFLMRRQVKFKGSLFRVLTRQERPAFVYEVSFF